MNRWSIAWAMLAMSAMSAAFGSGCGHSSAIKDELLAHRHGRNPNSCSHLEVVKTRRKDCDGYPIYKLLCDGEEIASEAINCGRGSCVAMQAGGRCFE